VKKIVIFIIILVFLGGGFLAYKKFVKKPSTEEKKAVVSKKKPQVNLIDLEKRPYVTLVPREDGREVSMTITKTHFGEDKVEYELEYQAGTMIQGAFGRIDFSEEPLPVTKKLLFGSCSKGKCKYDEDVSGGSLTLYFKGSEDYAVKGEFTIGQTGEKEGVFSSRDAKISLDVGEKGLSAGTFVIVSSTIGLPEEVEGKVLAGPVGFFTANSVKINQATLSFKGINEDLDKVKVLGWVNSQWQVYEAVKEEDGISSQVDSLGTFVLVSE